MKYTAVNIFTAEDKLLETLLIPTKDKGTLLPRIESMAMELDFRVVISTPVVCRSIKELGQSNLHEVFEEYKKG